MAFWAHHQSGHHRDYRQSHRHDSVGRRRHQLPQGEITDEQWEILKLAFVSTGRIAILSDQPEKDWMYDYRFLEAVRW